MKEAIQYTVKIMATVERTEKCGKDWKQVSNDPKAEWAYTPEIEKTVRREVTMLEQTVDELDIGAVIKAINNI